MHKRIDPTNLKDWEIAEAAQEDMKTVDQFAEELFPYGHYVGKFDFGTILSRIGKNVIGAIRQPSAGPTFNIKSSVAGGGLSQCISLTDFSLG